MVTANPTQASLSQVLPPKPEMWWVQGKDKGLLKLLSATKTSSEG